MVQFRDGAPNKSQYRRFKIQTVEGIDDFKAIAEIVRRRYFKLIANNEAMPNLIIIDGGKGQLNFALEELRKLNLRIPIISIAKREEEVFVPGLPNPLPIDKKDKSLNLIREIRDEAHRFAIKYNRLLRSKKMKE
jgi:excinuclease ABC subunit C